MGPALAAGQPLLLTSISSPDVKKGPGRQRPGLFSVPADGTALRVLLLPRDKKPNRHSAGNHFRRGDLFLIITLK
jgi:hypothetical protein